LIVTALEEAERLNSLISDILEMTRIESGEIQLHKIWLNPALTMPLVLKRSSDDMEKYHLDISLNKKIKINFDQTYFEQIMQNLLDNTIKYSLKNTKITIYYQLSKDSYRIFIKDEGMGIDPTKLNLIFNKFERFNLEDKILGNGIIPTITFNYTFKLYLFGLKFK
jgi:two-component system sensor histidine kinase KdpD